MSIRIHRVLAISAAAAVVLALAGPASAGSSAKPRVSAGAHHASAHHGKASIAAVLYNQNDNPSGDGVTAQNFEAGLDAFDAQAADDFSVPAGEAWSIDAVDVSGIYFTGPASSFNVSLYRDPGALPGALVASYPNVVATSDVAGDVSLPLSPTLDLTVGTYWISVQANLDSSGGQWFWETRTVGAGDAAAWQNPGNGFGSGCTTWGVRSVCIPATAADPDQLFAISGTSTACTISGQGYIAGTPGDDVICGSVNRDRVSGDDGNDTVFGGTGADVLNGRVGNDTLVAGPGQDTVRGARGNDTMNVADNAPGDSAVGGTGTDTATSDAGDTVTL